MTISHVYMYYVLYSTWVLYAAIVCFVHSLVALIDVYMRFDNCNIYDSEYSILTKCIPLQGIKYGESQSESL
jgi:hypothetical protein